MVVVDDELIPVELVEVDKELATLEEDDVELNPMDVAEGIVEDEDVVVVVVDEVVVEDVTEGMIEDVDEDVVEGVVVVVLEGVVVATPEQPIIGSAFFPEVTVVPSVVSVSPKKETKIHSKDK